MRKIFLHYSPLFDLVVKENAKKIVLREKYFFCDEMNSFVEESLQCHELITEFHVA